VAEQRNQDEREQEHDRVAALDNIGWNYPPWYAWAGVGGILYARRPQPSPPIIVRSGTTEGLREAIEEAERERGLR
jgi:hypothetical protein